MESELSQLAEDAALASMAAQQAYGCVAHGTPAHFAQHQHQRGSCGHAGAACAVAAAAAASAAGAGQQQPGALTYDAATGYHYDPATGYFYDPATGVYVDSTRGLYYHPAAQAWCPYGAHEQSSAPVHAAAHEQPTVACAHAAMASERAVEHAAPAADARAGHAGAYATGVYAAAPVAELKFEQPSAAVSHRAPSAVTLGGGAPPVKLALVAQNRKAVRLKGTARPASFAQEEDEAPPAAAETSAPVPTAAAPSAPKPPAPADDTAAAENGPAVAAEHLELADFDTLVCRLCERRLPSAQLLRRHLAESTLHRDKYAALVKRRAAESSYARQLDEMRSHAVGNSAAK